MRSWMRTAVMGVALLSGMPNGIVPAQTMSAASAPTASAPADPANAGRKQLSDFLDSTLR